MEAQSDFIREAKGHYQAGDAKAALDSARDGLALHPRNADLAMLAGVAAAALDLTVEAEAWYRQALALDPDFGAAYSNLGLLLAKREAFAEAEQCYRQAILLSPLQPEAYTNLGLLLTARHRDEEAETWQRLALARNPRSSEIHSNLANVLAKRGKEAEAETHYRRAIELAPASAAAHMNYGTLLANSGRDEEAEALLRHAIDLRPGYPLASFNLGCLRLAHGHFAEGWALREARCDLSLPDRDLIASAVPFPQWQGEPLAGKRMLLWLEQGFGDGIQFCRYVALLKDRGAARITLICRQPLKRLMETLAGVDERILFEELPRPIPPHDYWSLSLSLPFHCEPDPHRLAFSPYLRATPERIARWAPRLPATGLRIGLVWRGNFQHENDEERSLPGLEVLAPLWSVPGTAFISLQKGMGEDQAAHPPADQPLLHLGGELDDYAETAAVVAQLDLLICVDTSVAHLAGALGKPCWVLLPAYKTDWRWLRACADTPWYPSLRLFRQRQRGDWTPVLEEVRQALSDKASGAIKGD